MTDFEKQVLKLRSDNDEIENKHFFIYEYEDCKYIEIYPHNLSTDCITFKYDKNGNFLTQL